MPSAPARRGAIRAGSDQGGASRGCVLRLEVAAATSEGPLLPARPASRSPIPTAPTLTLASRAAPTRATVDCIIPSASRSVCCIQHRSGPSSEAYPRSLGPSPLRRWLWLCGFACVCVCVCERREWLVSRNAGSAHESSAKAWSTRALLATVNLALVVDDSTQAVTRMERLKGLRGVADTVELVRHKVAELDLATERLLNKHRDGIAGLPSTDCAEAISSTRHVSAPHQLGAWRGSRNLVGHERVRRERGAQRTCGACALAAGDELEWAGRDLLS